MLSPNPFWACVLQNLKILESRLDLIIKGRFRHPCFAHFRELLNDPYSVLRVANPIFHKFTYFLISIITIERFVEPRFEAFPDAEEQVPSISVFSPRPFDD